MSSQPKYRLGDDVSVDFMGKIVSVHYTFKGDVQYKIEGTNGNSAYAQESNIFPVPQPEPKPQPAIQCKVCQQIFPAAEFDSHLFKDGHLKLDHEPPGIYRYQDGVCYFCGGNVSTTGNGIAGWTTECDNCGFLWDED